MRFIANEKDGVLFHRQLASIAIVCCILPHLAVLQAHDLLEVLDLCVARNLSRARVTHIQQLAPAHRAAPVSPVGIGVRAP